MLKTNESNEMAAQTIIQTVYLSIGSENENENVNGMENENERARRTRESVSNPNEHQPRDELLNFIAYS